VAKKEEDIDYVCIEKGVADGGVADEGVASVDDGHTGKEAEAEADQKKRKKKKVKKIDCCWGVEGCGQTEMDPWICVGGEGEDQVEGKVGEVNVDEMGGETETMDEEEKGQVE